jgi:hypothetical protein
MMYRFPGNPPDYPTMEEASAAYYATNGQGWDQKICNQLNAGVSMMLPDNGNEGLYYVSQGCTSRVGHPLGPFPDGLSYFINPTHSYYQLKLTSGPLEVVTSARAQAQYDLYYTNIELGRLDCSQGNYFALEGRFNQAVTEFFKGEHYLSPAVSGTGVDGEAIYQYARSLRAFTRCQALARQVFNYLTPPADRPESLGLKPYKYWEKPTRQ